MDHSFNVDVAMKYGVHEAIFIHNLYFWILKNTYNGRHFYEGRTWTYNSLSALEKLFPYFTRKQIRTVISHCEEKGAVIRGNFCEDGSDRTNWFALTDDILDMYGLCQGRPADGDERSELPELYALEGTEGYAPEGTTYAPEGTTYAPEGTTYAPEGTTYAPEGTTCALEGTTCALEGTHADNKPDNKPDIYKINNIFSSGPDESAKKRKKRAYDPESTPYKIAAYFLSAILKNKPDFRQPTEAAFQGWADSARMMLERDGRDKRRIKNVIDFCQSDPFWRRNILSVPKLREKFDQLELQMASGPPVQPMSTREAARRMYER